jgi:hypothetical protein
LLVAVGLPSSAALILPDLAGRLMPTYLSSGQTILILMTNTLCWQISLWPEASVAVQVMVVRPGG